MITVGYTCNDGYFEGAYLTTLSILRRTKEECHFYLLSGDFTDIDPRFTIFSKKHEQIMNDLVKSFNHKNSFEVIDCRPLYDKYFKNLKWRRFWKRYWTPYVFLRLFIFELNQFQNKVIFLDLDIMFCDDIKKIHDVDATDVDFVCARDLFTRSKHFKKYYNTGVMLINMDHIRKSKNLIKTINYIINKRPLIMEQDALCMCCDIKRFPGNDFRFNHQADSIKDDTIVKHFWSFIRLKPSHRGIRPWQIDKVQNVLKLHVWDDDYSFFLDNKKKWGGSDNLMHTHTHASKSSYNFLLVYLVLGFFAKNFFIIKKSFFERRMVSQPSF